jgi:hypothetical protein
MTDAHPDATDPLQVLAVCGWRHETQIIDELKRELADATARRDRHVRALHDMSLSYRDIASLLGVSASRIGQVMARITTCQPPRQERSP